MPSESDEAYQKRMQRIKALRELDSDEESDDLKEETSKIEPKKEKENKENQEKKIAETEFEFMV